MPTELRYLQNVLEAPPRVRRAVPGGCRHLRAHGRLRLAAPRPEVHQLHGLLRKHTEAAVQGRTVSWLSRLLGVKLHSTWTKGTSCLCPTQKRPRTFIFMNFGFLSVFFVKWMYVRVFEEGLTEQWQMGRKNVCQRRKLRKVFLCFVFFFFLCIL